ncbi:MAG: MogA/MoaB family molybdenum cofactor biosynthesis protein [Chloroflexota bacterium]|nr:MogA/MoaB family molybdenum cofactor biosynthesis protein [Chloroflexota bacterium]
MSEQFIPCAVLTVSDRCASGEAEDQSGPVLVELLQNQLPGARVTDTAVVPDEVAAIQVMIRRWADEQDVALIVTTGGTGFAPRDRTPEAVRPLLDREAPGLVVAMLNTSLAVTPYAMLSRPIAGMRDQTLIVTLPGNPKGARENLERLLRALPHGIALLREMPGENQRHGR